MKEKTSLIEKAIQKVREEGKPSSAGELVNEVDPKNIVSGSSPRKHSLALGLSILSLLIVLFLGFFLYRFSPNKSRILSSVPPVSNTPIPSPSYSLRENALSPESHHVLTSSSPSHDSSLTSLQVIGPDLSSQVPISAPKEETGKFKHLELELNGEKHILKNGERLQVKRGDLIRVEDVILEGILSKDVTVNFIGFVGNRLDNNGEDRGYTINTASDLWERYSLDGKGMSYSITIEKGKERIGTVYVDLVGTRPITTKVEEAAKIVEPSETKQNAQTESLLKKAFVYNQAGNHALAVQCYDKILSLEPQHFEALLNRGILKEKLEDLEGAEKDLLAAQQINPDDPVLLNALGVLYLRTGDEREAETYFLKARDTTSKINLALHYWGKGEKEKVMSILKKAENEDSQNPYPPFYLGLFYRQTGNNALAQEELNRSLSLAQKRGLFELIHEIESLPSGP